VKISGVGPVLLTAAAVVAVGVIGYGVTALGNPPVKGAGTKPGYTPPSAPVVVAFLGDSYTAGSGASHHAHRWTSLLSAAEGWTEANFGQPGTGYTNNGSQGESPYPARVAAVAAAHPSIVVVSGGQNDETTDPQTEAAAVTRTFTALRKALPKAQIIGVGPSVPSPDQVPLARPIDSAVRAAVGQVHGRYVSLLSPDPLAGPGLLASDHEHPDDKGYAAIAAQVRRALARD
jgi:lysophospholipase L1-like esterase